MWSFLTSFVFLSMLSGFIYVGACISTSFIFMVNILYTTFYLSVWQMFVLSSAFCCHETLCTIFVQILILIHLQFLHASGIAELCGSSNLLRKCQTVSKEARPFYIPIQLYVRVPVSPYPHQNLCLSFLLCPSQLVLSVSYFLIF